MAKANAITQSQEVYLQFYNHALTCFQEGREEEGKRAIICAASTLIDIGAQCSNDTRRLFVQKANRLLEQCAAINTSTYRDIFKSLDDEALGLDIKMRVIEQAVIEKGKAMDMVAGLEDTKKEINRLIVYPMQYMSLYKRYKKECGGGILLYGLPGTGKTMIADAVAQDMDAKFIAVKCSDILSKYVGETEAKVKEIFDSARQSKRAVIFFDEFDAIGCKRSDELNDASYKLVSELLVQMQGIDKCQDAEVIILAATNRPWDIDNAFLRPGRFNRKIYVPLPNAQAREQIITQSLKGVPVEEGFDVKRIADLTDGYNGADVHELCELLKILAIEREIATGEPSFVSTIDADTALSQMTSSVCKDEIAKLNAYRGVNAD